MNNCSFVGRLTANPELKKTPNGVSVTAFSIAVKRPHVADTTDFINCVAWRQSAEYIANYGVKGNLVSVTGPITSRKFTDKDNNNRTTYEVIVDSVSLLTTEKKEKEEQSYNPYENSPQTANFEAVEGDADLPF